MRPEETVTKRFYPTRVPRPGQPERESQADSAYFEGLEDIQLEEEAARARVGSGYNPYDTVPNLREPDSAQRHADLRRLSEWIRLKRQMEMQRDKDAAQSSGNAALEDTLPGDRPFWPGRA
jgi:hypothetical protein